MAYLPLYHHSPIVFALFFPLPHPLRRVAMLDYRDIVLERWGLATDFLATSRL